MVAIIALDRAFALRHQDTVVSGDPAVLAAARSAFATSEVCYFRNVVEPVLLAQILAAGRSAPFEPEIVDGLGERRQERDDQIGSALRNVLSRAPLLRWMEEAAQCGPLVGVSGRVVETRAGSGQGLTWHNDLFDRHRRLALVVNLSDHPYSGGEFEMRRLEAPHNHFSFVHEEPGSMMIFRVGDHLVHRVLPVTAGGPRRVFAGWMVAATELPRAGQA